MNDLLNSLLDSISYEFLILKGVVLQERSSAIARLYKNTTTSGSRKLLLKSHCGMRVQSGHVLKRARDDYRQVLSELVTNQSKHKGLPL